MKVIMKIAPNPAWRYTELLCEKTGISIRKYTMLTEPFYINYGLRSGIGKDEEQISKWQFKVIKKLLM